MLEVAEQSVPVHQGGEVGLLAFDIAAYLMVADAAFNDAQPDIEEIGELSPQVITIEASGASPQAPLDKIIPREIFDGMNFTPLSAEAYPPNRHHYDDWGFDLPAAAPQTEAKPKHLIRDEMVMDALEHGVFPDDFPEDEF